MRAYVVATALVLAGSLNPAAGSEDLAPNRSPDRVVVYRGSEGSHASPIAVYRGSAAPPGYLSAPASFAGPDTEPVGGRHIWFVDRANDRLTNCRAWNTTMIGQRRIVCTPSRRLPD
jgi:hypothetical protein